MGDYRDDHSAQTEEELGHLEDAHEAERERPRGRAADPRELPRPLYRIKATHSNETFYAYFPQAPEAPATQEAEPKIEPAIEPATEMASPAAIEAAAEDDRVLEPAVTAALGFIAPRTMVVVPTRYGRDVCELQGVVAEPGQLSKDEIVPIERIATEEDLHKVEANRERENKAFETCRLKIAARNLPMKLVSAHYLLEEPKVLFYFSA
jgi:hypothetical protein